jgi:hypothetical protein
MKAIIDPRESVSHIVEWKNLTTSVSEIYPNSGRVCQVEPDNETFPVGEPLYWTDCPDDCKADYFWCDLINNVVSPIVNAPRPPAEDQPTSTGTQTV